MHPWTLFLALAFLLSCITQSRGDAQDTEAKPFVTSFGTNPTFQVTLDRSYEIMMISGSQVKKALDLYLFAPKDDQSSVVFGIGKDRPVDTEEGIAHDYEGAKVTKKNGTIHGSNVQWWEWEDSKHLYSVCSFELKNTDGNNLLLHLYFVANTTERRALLEKAFSNIELKQ